MATEKKTSRPAEKVIEFPEMTPAELLSERENADALAAAARIMGGSAPMMWLHSVRPDGTEVISASTDKKLASEGRYFAICDGEPGTVVKRLSYWIKDDIIDSFRTADIKLTEKDFRVFASFEEKSEGIMKHGRHVVHGSGKILYNICLKEQVEAERKKKRS